MSLQAAATMNAGLQNEVSRGSSSSSATRSRQSPSSSRRRSTVLMNLQVNDPTVPAPGEMVNENQNSANGVGPSSPRPSNASPMLLPRSPHHSRTPSLGELHQELEEEQEAQVNRLLQMIRQQQLQLQQLQAAQGTGQSADDTSAISDRSGTQNSQAASTPHSGLPIPSGSFSQSGSTPQSGLPMPSGSFSQSPRQIHPRSSFDMARADLHRRSRTPSRGTSQGASPRLRAASISAVDLGEGSTLSGRDESAFYQAETQMLVRENQMLKHRVRELEKQLTEAQITPSARHESGHRSSLAQASAEAQAISARHEPGRRSSLAHASSAEGHVSASASASSNPSKNA